MNKSWCCSSTQPSPSFVILSFRLLLPRAHALSLDMQSAMGRDKCLYDAEPFTGYIKFRRCFPVFKRPHPDSIVVRIPNLKWLNWHDATCEMSLIVQLHRSFINASGISTTGISPHPDKELIHSTCPHSIETTCDNFLAPRSLASAVAFGCAPKVSRTDSLLPRVNEHWQRQCPRDVDLC